MIIEIKQIKNNFKIEFEIYENENLINLGKCSRVTSIFTNQLLDIEGNLVYKTEFDPIKELQTQYLSNGYGAKRNQM